MLFNSLPYIFVFLPLVLCVYFCLNRLQFTRSAKYWLVLASLFFYSWWNPKYLPLILTSITLNFLMGRLLIRSRRRSLLFAGLVFNLGLLIYYKYTTFIIQNINLLLHTAYNPGPIVLPLAISFFTFLQIAYLVDCYQQKVKSTDFIDYSLFVTFFPHLIAGPLVHHSELIPQFSMPENKQVNWNNFYTGLCVFFIGLFKKVVIADTFAIWANAGFDASVPLTFYDAWGSSLSYTLQLYFDFSGYGDMAVGASLLFNIRLPWNFNSPYKATNIQDFWRRWHITLSRWLRNYLYIPLGGNRYGSFRTGVNLFLTFLLGGLWHGANWTFVIWGAMHGLGAVAHKAWQSMGLKMSALAGWLVTFLYIHIAWVFFRAKTLDDAKKVLHGLVDFQSAQASSNFANAANYFIDSPLLNVTATGINPLLPVSALLLLLIMLPVAWLARNTVEISNDISRDERRTSYFLVVTGMACCALFEMIYLSSRISEFIYFHF